jgi:hypothetical protein
MVHSQVWRSSFPPPLNINRKTVLKLVHEWFLSNYFQLVSHRFPHHLKIITKTSYRTMNCAWSKPQAELRPLLPSHVVWSRHAVIRINRSQYTAKKLHRPHCVQGEIPITVLPLTAECDCDCDCDSLPSLIPSHYADTLDSPPCHSQFCKAAFHHQRQHTAVSELRGRTGGAQCRTAAAPHTRKGASDFQVRIKLPELQLDHSIKVQRSTKNRAAPSLPTVFKLMNISS